MKVSGVIAASKNSIIKDRLDQSKGLKNLSKMRSRQVIEKFSSSAVILNKADFTGQTCKSAGNVTIIIRIN